MQFMRILMSCFHRQNLSEFLYWWTHFRQAWYYAPWNSEVFSSVIQAFMTASFHYQQVEDWPCLGESSFDCFSGLFGKGTGTLGSITGAQYAYTSSGWLQVIVSFTTWTADTLFTSSCSLFWTPGLASYCSKSRCLNIAWHSQVLSTFVMYTSAHT